MMVKNCLFSFNLATPFLYSFINVVFDQDKLISDGKEALSV